MTFSRSQLYQQKLLFFPIFLIQLNQNQQSYILRALQVKVGKIFVGKVAVGKKDMAPKVWNQFFDLDKNLLLLSARTSQARHSEPKEGSGPGAWAVPGSLASSFQSPDDFHQSL